jgi:hypothetical protein
MISRFFLHIGCGPKRKDETLPAFQSDDWQEVRFDIDESVAPDIIGTMTDMSAVETGSMGPLFCCDLYTFLLDRRKAPANSSIFSLASI